MSRKIRTGRRQGHQRFATAGLPRLARTRADRCVRYGLREQSHRDGGAKPLAGDQFRGRGSGLGSSEVAGVLDGPRALVFLQVGSIDGVLQALAPGSDGADGNLTPGDLDGAAWLLEERPVPAARLETPGANERPPLHHDDPNPDEAVRLP